MDAATMAAAGSLILSAEGALVYGAAKLARMAASLEDLKDSMRVVAGKVEDHEKRLNQGGL